LLIADAEINIQDVQRFKEEEKKLGTKCKYSVVVIGGLVVIVLPTGTKVRGFKPGQGRCIIRAMKITARLSTEGK
jgi:hypothetical protein